MGLTADVWFDLADYFPDMWIVLDPFLRVSSFHFLIIQVMIEDIYTFLYQGSEVFLELFVVKNEALHLLLDSNLCLLKFKCLDLTTFIADHFWSQNGVDGLVWDETWTSFFNEVWGPTIRSRACCIPKGLLPSNVFIEDFPQFLRSLCLWDVLNLQSNE